MPEMTPEDFQRELTRMRDAVQVFTETQAAAGVHSWPLAMALGEKAIQVLHLHHGQDEALRLLDGLREVIEQKE